MAMNPKDFTVQAARSFLEKQYPSTIGDETLTEADKIFNEKLASAAREKVKNPSSKSWDKMMEEQSKGIKKVIGGRDFPLTPENTKALGRAIDDDVLEVIKKSSPMETPYGKSFFSYTPEGKLAGIPAKMLNETKGVVKKVGSAVPFAGPAMAAGEVLAGENDIGKMAAGVIGSDLLATLGSAAPGNAIVKGIATGTGAVAGYPLGQAVYQKVVPESVQEKLKLSPEDRMKIKEMISKGKSGIKSILRPLPAGVPKGSVPVGDAGFYKTPDGKLVQTMFPKK